MRRTYKYVSLAGLALASLALAACGKKSDQSADSTASQLTVGTENVVIARMGSVTNGPAISGSLDASLDATVRAQVAGAVLSTSADIGQSVSKGQVLARIDPAGLQDAYLSARSAVSTAQATAEVAERNLARSRTLLQAGAIAQRDLETAQTQASSAASALADARARFATAQKSFENTRVVAPFSGIVSQKSVGTGDVVQPGGAMFTVIDPSTMRLQASVPSDQLGLVKAGTDVVFSVTGYPGRQFHGTVARVSPAVDPTTRQVQILVSIPNSGHALVSGLYADGRVSSATRNGIVVPMTAVDLRMQRPAVVRVRGGKAERVDVALGMRDPTAETVEIATGVSVGDTLLVGAAQGITPGTPVRVQAPPSDRGIAGGGGSVAGSSSGVTGGVGGTVGGATSGTNSTSGSAGGPPANANGTSTGMTTPPAGAGPGAAPASQGSAGSGSGSRGTSSGSGTPGA